jgi:hypothetical protein
LLSIDHLILFLHAFFPSNHYHSISSFAQYLHGLFIWFIYTVFLYGFRTRFIYTVFRATMALLDAGVPLKNPVAGLSIGLVTSDKLEKAFPLGDQLPSPVSTALFVRYS